MKILIAEDEPTSAFLLKTMLHGAGHETVVTGTGLEAYVAYRSEKFDAILTDWMMPELDGIGLVEKIRSHGQPSPVIIMVSALTEDDDKQRAINAGVDGYVSKPIKKEDILALLQQCKEQRQSPVPERKKVNVAKNTHYAPAVAVGIAASTGGPPVLAKLVSNLPTDMGATYFITQHGPDWTLDALATRLGEMTKMPIFLAETGMSLRPNAIYLAPGGHHLTCTKTFKVKLCERETSIGLIPAADPMFASIAEAYGDNP
ncbi:MAG: response regulator [Kofleriaceae bacterium]|nr:response regulator [Kofleriaceae bacterium]